MSHQIEYENPKERRLFIQMSGAPGSGKSTLARLLGRSINGIVLDHDILRSAQLQDGDIDIPFDEAAKRAYRLQWTLAEDFLKQGFSVIIDSTCNYQMVLDNGSALAEKYGCAYWYVECRVEDIDLLDGRLRARNPLASQRTSVDQFPVAATKARVGENPRDRFKKWIENPCRPEGGNIIVVDSRDQPEAVRDEVLDRIVGQLGK